MSVEVVNETPWIIDLKQFSDLGVWGLDQMRVSTQSDLSITFVDPATMAQLHEQWMDLKGPTDVMSFPMDELRPGDGRTRPEGILGDIVLSPDVAAQQAASAGHSTIEELMLLTCHGILHLLGYDHTDHEAEKIMFGMQRQLLLTFLALRPGSVHEVVLPAGVPDPLAEYERSEAGRRDD